MTEAQLEPVFKSLALADDKSLMDPAVFRKQIVSVEAKMRELTHALVQIKTHHYISHGLYVREIHVPKDVFIVGKIAKKETINIVSAGDLWVQTEEGLKRIKAPYTGISKAGIKRIGYSNEPTVWATAHAIGETDLEKIEQALWTENYDDFDFSKESVSGFKFLETLEGYL
jgi:hypothetical protein